MPSMLAEVEVNRALTRRFGRRPEPGLPPSQQAVYFWLYQQYSLTSAVRWQLWSMVLEAGQNDPGVVGERIGRTRVWVCNRLRDDAELRLTDVADLTYASGRIPYFRLWRGDA